MKTVVVTIPGMINPEDIAVLKSTLDVTYHEVESVTEDKLANLASGAEILMLNFDVVVNGCKEISPEFWTRGELANLKMVNFDMTGIDWASPSAAMARGITLINIPHYSTQSVAESVLAEILLHTRQRHLAYVDRIKGRPVTGRKGMNLSGRTIGVVGLGSIGSKVAELCEAIGMNVIAWNRSAREGRTIVSLDELFAKSDVIVIALKTEKEGSNANVGIVGEQLLVQASGVVVVNLANSALVDEGAMARAIQAKKVLAYSLDRNENSVAGPLGDLDEVHFPPANAWNSDESLDTLRLTWVANSLCFAKGEPQNLVQL